jgi:hypothetical protein
VDKKTSSKGATNSLICNIKLVVWSPFFKTI